MLTITALYAGILGLMLMAIAAIVGTKRAPTKISIGDGGNIEVIAAMRRHANFIEFVPMVLILMGLLEINGVSSNVIHGLGAALVVARAAHAFGYRADESQPALRGIGAVLSSLTLVVASVWSITTFF